jgi:hypothetical protein
MINVIETFVIPGRVRVSECFCDEGCTCPTTSWKACPALDRVKVHLDINGKSFRFYPADSAWALGELSAELMDEINWWTA